MSDHITDPKWLVHCRMTAIGGSERGECACACPRDCKLSIDPDYPQARVEAKERIKSLLRDTSKEQS